MNIYEFPDIKPSARMRMIVAFLLIRLLSKLLIEDYLNKYIRKGI